MHQDNHDQHETHSCPCQWQDHENIYDRCNNASLPKRNPWCNMMPVLATLGYSLPRVHLIGAGSVYPRSCKEPLFAANDPEQFLSVCKVSQLWVLVRIQSCSSTFYLRVTFNLIPGDHVISLTDVPHQHTCRAAHLGF
jgi:hypothetical protein